MFFIWVYLKFVLCIFFVDYLYLFYVLKRVMVWDKYFRIFFEIIFNLFYYISFNVVEDVYGYVYFILMWIGLVGVI